jgi:hypothetical protein
MFVFEIATILQMPMVRSIMMMYLSVSVLVNTNGMLHHWFVSETVQKLKTLRKYLIQRRLRSVTVSMSLFGLQVKIIVLEIVQKLKIRMGR